MMSRIKVSVVIPIYNVEEYLQCCLESVVANFLYFKPGEVEAILVNDGSTDCSRDIARKFCDVRNEFIYIEQANKGLSAARNTGIKRATGEYVFFLDSDDFLIEDVLYQLCSFADESGCGITQCGITYYFGDSRDYVAQDTKCFDSNKILEKEKAIELLIKNKAIKNFACGKLYRRELIENMPFPIGKYFEDSYWQYRVICSDKYTKYGIVPNAGYQYRQRQNSITGIFSWRAVDLLEGKQEMCCYMKQNHPEHFRSSVYQLWMTLLMIDSQLRREKPQNSYIERINKVRHLFDEMSICLRDDIGYRIWKRSSFIFFLYTKVLCLKEKMYDKLNISRND